MQQMPQVSVIMPAYNAEDYLQEAIASVQAQTMSDWELIIVNDGSTDRTPEIVRAAAEKDDRIQLVSQENGRQGKARNTGIKQARAEVIALHDADDLWDPTLLETQLALMAEHQVDVICSNVRVIYEDIEHPEEVRGLFFEIGNMGDGRYTSEQFFRELVESNKVVTQTAMFRKAAGEKVAFFEERLQFQNCEDYDLWLRMAHAGASFYGHKKILGTYRRHSRGSISDAIKQFVPEINVMNKLHDAGMITNEQWQTSVSWLMRVLLFNYYKSGRYRAILKTLSGKGEVKVFPGNPVMHFMRLGIDVLKDGAKSLLLFLIGGRRYHQLKQQYA